jgi:hypothetical protein
LQNVSFKTRQADVMPRRLPEVKGRSSIRNQAKMYHILNSIAYGDVLLGPTDL